MNNCHKYGSKPPRSQHHTTTAFPATSTSSCHLLTPTPAPFLPTPHLLLRLGPSASTSAARLSMVQALLAQRQAWASSADAICRHSKALCRVDFRAVKQRNPHRPCEGLTEAIHAWSGGSWRLQNNECPLACFLLGLGC